jgi:hypothetical protein
MGAPNPEKSKRMPDATLKMHQISMADLRKAYYGG